MEEEERKQIILHLQKLDERLFGDSERIQILEKIQETYCLEILAESERIEWMFCFSTNSLERRRVLRQEEYGNFIHFCMVLVLLGRYKRKRRRSSQPQQKIQFLPTLEKDPFTLRQNEYKHHYPECVVDRCNFKLSFTLKHFLLNAREISGGSFTWFRSEGGECWFEFQHGVIFIYDMTRFESLTIYSSNESIEIDGKTVVRENGRLDLSQYTKPDESLLIKAVADLSVVFPGTKRGRLRIMSQSSCKFDFDPCCLEYYSMEKYPFPYRFYIPDVDHLLNLERMLWGKSPKPMSPNSYNKMASGWGFHENMERLKSLRRMKVDQSLSHPIPFFSIGNKPLSVVKECENSLILYENDYSLAKCTLRPEKGFLLLDLIESHESKVLPFEKIYRYPLY